MTYLTYLVVITFLLIILLLNFNFIKDHLAYKRRMRKLKQWSQFHEQLMEWSKEIVDVDIRSKFINHCINKLINTNVDKELIDLINILDIDKEKQKIYTKWGKYIPSLTKEIRDKKLIQILNE